MKALILAGGFGKRLRPITRDIPKPLVEVAGKPIIGWQFEWLKKYGIREVILAVGYLREKMMEVIGSGRNFGVRVSYVVEDVPLGTGGGVKNAEPFLKNEDFFYVLNGDIISDIDLSLLGESLEENIVGTIAIVPLPSPYGIVEYDPSTLSIKRFVEKPIISDYWINAGVYCFTPEIFDYLPEKGDIEKTSFPLLANKGKLKAVPYKDVFWKSIDTHKDVEEASKILRKIKY